MTMKEEDWNEASVEGEGVASTKMDALEEMPLGPQHVLM